MSDFTAMNPPVSPDGKAYISASVKDRRLWTHCGWCGHKLFPVDDDTKIEHLRMMCKDSKCKRITEINV